MEGALQLAKSTQQLARVIKEAKAQFERECANLPRPEIDRLWQQLWQRQWSEFTSLTPYTAVYHGRSLLSDPIGTNTSEPWKTWSPLLAASNVTDVAST